MRPLTDHDCPGSGSAPAEPVELDASTAACSDCGQTIAVGYGGRLIIHEPPDPL